ncbi:SURF1 family protein [Kribbella solani]|uniref:SURF1-like protein n=1 Tax=Kribbella solani TaxID=236067 RepID=A0A841DVI4_9ACTN|nr:SURF1 family protein [Kribbella solani]MBB5981961.1 cytochrome oxidase assembly protein ShyY1 [Kribbella solani]
MSDTRDLASDSQPDRPLWRIVLTPRWSGLLALALAIAAVMSVLGVWQLDVYHSKTANATAKRAEGAPVSLQSLFSIDEGLPSKAVGRRVTVEGTWGPAADQVLIANRSQGGRDGFWVASPVKLDASGGVMVVRGWVPSVSDPAVKAPTGTVRLTGAVVASEAEDSSGDAAKGRVLSSLRIPTIVHMVDYRLYDAFVVETSLDAGVVPAPAPAAVTPPPPPTEQAGLRNVAYAFQWWVFAAFTLWMWGRMVIDAHRSQGESDDPDDDAGDDAGEGPDDGARADVAVGADGAGRTDGSGALDDRDGLDGREADQAGARVGSSGTVSA